MNNNSHIPENDPDLKAAREYGDILRGEKTSTSDPFLEHLFKARDLEEEQLTEIPVHGQSAGWTRIENQINRKETGQNVFRLYSLKTWYWAAAAVALVIFASVLLLQQTIETGPELVAQSGTTISTVDLAYGSSVTLRPNSAIYKLSLTDSEQTYSLSGEALFTVDSSGGRSFNVEAGKGRVVVTGTRFNLSDRNQITSVHLLEGNVRFETMDRSESIELSAGEAAIVENNELLEPFSFEADEITGWTTSRLTFRDREAESIFAELEFHFNITIEAPEYISRETLGGSIRLHNAEESLEDLGIVLGGNFVETDESTYQFRSD